MSKIDNKLIIGNFKEPEKKIIEFANVFQKKGLVTRKINSIENEKKISIELENKDTNTRVNLISIEDVIYITMIYKKEEDSKKIMELYNMLVL